MIRAALLFPLLWLALACGAKEEYAPGSLERELQERFGASSVEVHLVTPPRHLEVVLRAGDFEDADQGTLIALTGEVARFVADRLVDDSGIERIVVDLVTREVAVGDHHERTAIRGEHPLASLTAAPASESER